MSRQHDCLAGTTTTSAAPPPTITARNVSKRYGSTLALDDVSVDVRPGEIVALAGENGSGKSTLAKILAGVLLPDSGRLEIDGASHSFSTPRHARQAGVALVTQEPATALEMTVAENVLLPLLGGPLRRVTRRSLARRARPILTRIGLDVDPLRRVATLAAGQRELVELARALAVHPRLLILDEATTRLPDSDRLFAVIHRLRADGVATLLITHRLREIREHADRVVVLRDGRLVGELSQQELSDERISSMMVGRELREFFHKEEGLQTGEVVLRLEELVVAGSREAISLELREGEIVGLAGLMGAGRTELLETIAGVRRPVSGSVLVDAAGVRPGSPAAALRAGIALVPEDRLAQGLIATASVRRNLALRSLRPFRRVDTRRERVDATAMVDRLGVRCPGVEAPVSTLSGGNQQKVVIGLALSRRPRVLLLDEPTRGVDVGAKEEIYRVIGGLLKDGVAVLVASSDLLEILGLCDRVLAMYERGIAGVIERHEATEARIALLAAGGAATLGC